ncbi:methyltransferase-like protein [Cladorrhinum sp. PSN259]|nr:methyltransferase-like protein [Cladorrhinum sp. PSN259]
MSLFTAETVSPTLYAEFRPTYPQSLYDLILAYHGPFAPGSVLLDLGAGPGTVALDLSSRFYKVHAVDPSPDMVSQARRAAVSLGVNNLSSHPCPAEKLPSIIGPASIDLVVSGEAAHWFDFSQVWPELARVVKPGGTLAFWAYKHFVIQGQPGTTEIFEKYIFGEGEVRDGVLAMHAFADRKGWGVLRNSYREIQPPGSEWEEENRIVFDPERDDVTKVKDGEGTWMRKRMKLGELEGFVRTFSAFGRWKKEYEEFKSRSEGGKDGDLVDWLFDDVVGAVEEGKDVGEEWRGIEVDVVWGTVLLMAKRRPYEINKQEALPRQSVGGRDPQPSR